MPPSPVDWSERAEQIAQWRASQLPLSAWASQHHVRVATLAYWRKHLRQSQPQPARDRGEKSLLKLAPIQIAPPPISAGAGIAPASILLHSPGGWQITLPAGTDMGHVLGLLKSLS